MTAASQPGWQLSLPRKDAGGEPEPCPKQADPAGPSSGTLAGLPLRGRGGREPRTFLPGGLCSAPGSGAARGWSPTPTGPTGTSSSGGDRGRRREPSSRLCSPAAAGDRSRGSSLALPQLPPARACGMLLAPKNTSEGLFAHLGTQSSALSGWKAPQQHPR